MLLNCNVVMDKYNETNKIYKKHVKYLKCLVAFVAFCVPSSAFAVTNCTPEADGSYLPGWTGQNASCNYVPGTVGELTLSANNPFYILTRSNLKQQVSVGDTKLLINRPSEGWSGVGNQYAQGELGASIALADFSATVTAQYGTIIGTHSMVTVTAKDINVVANYNYTNGGNSSGGVASYGVLAGSTVASGEKYGTGQYSTVSIDNLSLDQRAVGGRVGLPILPGLGLLDTPVLNNGLRAIQGASDDSGLGSSGQIIINNQLNMTLSGWRLEGIYVSGAGTNSSGDVVSSQVILNNSNIKLIQEADSNGEKRDYQSSAIKVGKARATGKGKGEVYSKGLLNIDASQAVGDAIKIYDSQSIFKADYDTSVTNILANKSVIAVGPSDWQVSGNVAASNNSVFLNNANLNTVSSTDSLVKVYDNQTNFILNIKGAASILNSAVSGLLLEVGNNSTVTANLDGGKYFGMTSIGTDSKLDVNMTNNAVWYLKDTGTNIAQVSSLSLSSGATLNVAGNIVPGSKTIALHNDNKMNVADGDNLINTTLTADNSFKIIGNVISDAGVINLSKSGVDQPSYFTKLTIDGDYTGSNNALIKFDTQLGNDASPTDFLHIIGNSSGTTNVQVINRNGLGALTTGNGIQLIKVDGISDKSNFVLRSDYSFEGQAAVIGGAYAYSLYAGSAAGTFSGDWYLRSLYTKPVEPPVKPKPPVKPVYAPTVPLYEVYPQILLQLNKLGTLEQRVGSRTWLATAESAQTAVMNEVEGRGFWMRVEGSTGHVNPKESKTKSDYDYDLIKTQLGLDFIATENDKGKLIGGVYFQYGHAKADVSSRFGTGDIKTDGYGLGGTLTWYGANDIYVDGVAQMMWYDSDLRSDWLKNRNIVSGNDGTGYALSIEAGKKIKLDQEWTMTPQAQLSYNSVDFDDFNDNYGGHISIEDGHSLTGRLGVAFNREKVWKSEQGDIRRLKTYGIGNIYYEFLNGTQVSVTSVGFRNRSDRLWGGLGGGLSYNWKDDAYSIYGEVDGRTSFSDFGSSYSLNGTIGFRAKF